MLRRMKLFTLLLYMPFLSGCPAPSDAQALNHPLYLPIVNGQLVTIEIIRVNGEQAPGRSLEKAIEGFSKYVSGRVRSVEGAAVELETDANGLLDRAQLAPVIANRRHRGPSDIAVLIVPSLSDFRRRGYCQYLPGGGHAVVIHAEGIAKSFRLLPLQERFHLVIKHELSHALHVPRSRSHCWSDRHCTHPECILYPRVDVRSALTATLRLGPPVDLCGACRQEVRLAQEKAGGKLVGPEEPYDRITMLDETIALNPGHPLGYMHRAQARCNQKEYAKAIADLTKAIELDPKDMTAMCHRNRGALFVLLGGRSDRAISDYERCLQLKPDDVLGLINLASLLATCDDDGIRDGPRAVELALRACQLGRWKDDRALDVLAAAYAETGRFDRAIEYATKAIALANEAQVKQYRRLELYRDGRPWRDNRK